MWQLYFTAQGVNQYYSAQSCARTDVGASYATHACESTCPSSVYQLYGAEGLCGYFTRVPDSGPCHCSIDYSHDSEINMLSMKSWSIVQLLHHTRDAHEVPTQAQGTPAQPSKLAISPFTPHDTAMEQADSDVSGGSSAIRIPSPACQYQRTQVGKTILQLRKAFSFVAGEPR